MREKSKLIIFIFCLGLGIFLRLWKYPFYPFTGHAEEYLFVWSGLSLIETGVPISWNDIPVYEKKHIYWEGVAPNNSPSGGGLGVRLLKPWLDEPPLFSLIVGGMAKLYRLPNFTIISPYVIRIPPLLFAFISLIFVFLIANRFFGYTTGILSLLVYGTVPTIVFGSRLAVPENIITTLFLVSFCLISSYLDSHKKWQRNLAFFLAGLAGLAKPTGYLLVFFVSFILFQKKKIKESFLGLLTGSLIFWIPLLAYGKYFDWGLFWKVFGFQSSRPAGWSSLAFILTNPGFSIEVYLDGFVILGFISLVYLIFKDKKSAPEKYLLFSFVFTLLVSIISGGKHDQLAWYRYPIYPFLSISLALMIREVIKNANFFNSAIIIPLLLTNIDLLENPFWKFNSFIQSKQYRICFFILLLPAIINLSFENRISKKISQTVIIVCFAFSILINIWVVKSRFNILCDHEHCPLPEKIDVLKIFK